MSVNYDEVFNKHFDKIREQQAYVEDEDASRKSSIDSHIIPIVKTINESQHYFTTSSCSGRFIAYAQNEVHVKKNCEWIRVTHDPLDQDEMDKFIEAIEANQGNYKQIFLKFEPFILHVCCRTLAHAKVMLDQATASGYRNSGMSFGASKIILAVRSTQNLEMPVTDSGELIVNRQVIVFFNENFKIFISINNNNNKKYLSKVLMQKINDKFKENFERINKFYENLKVNCFNQAIEVTKTDKKAMKLQLRSEKKAYFDENRQHLMSNQLKHILTTQDDGLDEDFNIFE